jgi:hypothetical protein
LISANYSNLKTLSFGVNYETDRKYILFTISSSSDTSCTQAFVYNTFTNAWTTWEKSVVHGFVNVADDKLYLSDSGSENVFQERKDFTFTDYVDQELTGYNITSHNGPMVYLDTVQGVEIGDIIYQSSTVYDIIIDIDVPTKRCETANKTGFANSSCTILKAIECELEFSNQPEDNAGVMKHFQEIAWLFRDKSFNNGTTSFYTDISGGYSETEIAGSFGADLWGGFTWGSVPWGGIQRPSPIRVFIPREKSRGSLLSIKLKIRNAYAKWSLNGCSMQFEYVSERMTRL